jgi:hypothetical protein
MHAPFRGLRNENITVGELNSIKLPDLVASTITHSDCFRKNKIYCNSYNLHPHFVGNRVLNSSSLENLHSDSTQTQLGMKQD